MKPPVQFLAIGDIAVDAFISLDPAFTKIQIGNNGKSELVMPFGMKVPYQNMTTINAVGNAANAATSVARLGLSSAVMCSVGDDIYGSDCIAELQKNKIAAEYVTTEIGQHTNYHYVLTLGAERTILIKHSPFNYNISSQLADSPVPQWVYFTQGVLDHENDVANWTTKNNIKMTFQPGSLQIAAGYEKLQSVYAAAYLCVCNVEEAEQILGIKNSENLEKRQWVKSLVQKMRSLGPHIVAITDGPNGAYINDSDSIFFVPIYPDPKPPVSRTGAGDAFASTLSAYLAQGMSIKDACIRAPINSMSVVQHTGAQAGLLTADHIEEYLRNAPADYALQEI